MEKERQVIFTIKKEKKKKPYLQKPDLERKELVECKKARRRKTQRTMAQEREREREREREKVKKKKKNEVA